MRMILRVQCILTALSAVYVMCAFAQGPPRQTPDDNVAQIRRQRELENRRMGDLRRAEESARRSARYPSNAPTVLSAKEKKRLDALKAPKEEDIAANSEFLKRPRTGIVRLFPYHDCESEYVVRLDGDCADMIPGSSSHRFRKNGFSDDIVFRDGLLIADGFFATSIMTNLGNMPLEEVSFTTPGLQFVRDYIPAGEIAKAKEQYSSVTKGIVSGGYIYANRSRVTAGSAYALRIIAYRNGNNLNKRMVLYALYAERSLEDAGIPLFWRVRDDTRIDLTLAFRVVRVDTDGSVTLLWKELERKDSPKITFPDGELTDLKARRSRPERGEKGRR
jgi:hypothetical protein